MKGLVILSHGLESGPQATKVSALAEIARSLGWDSVRPDFRDLDARRDPRAIDGRVARVRALAPSALRVVFAGSSMGAFNSGLASLHCECAGLFLMALPLSIAGYPRRFDAARVPTVLVHGWRDELCPVDEAIAFARARGDTLHLVDDDHRLGGHVAHCAGAFHDLLQALG